MGRRETTAPKRRRRATRPHRRPGGARDDRRRSPGGARHDRTEARARGVAVAPPLAPRARAASAPADGGIE